MKLVDKPELPKEMFGQVVNQALLAQAVRVHLANQRQGNQSALTRSEVARTRKKYQKQKGTGNARHGDRKAPIFVGGGIAFAPKPREHRLAISDVMRRQAVVSALSAKNKDHGIAVISGMDKATGKTKEFIDFLDSKKTLIVTDQMRENVYRAARNLSGVTIMPMSQVNAYEILKADKVLIMEEAIEVKSVKSVKTVKSVTKKTKKS